MKRLLLQLAATLTVVMLGVVFSRPAYALDILGPNCGGAAAQSAVCQDRNVKGNPIYGQGSILAEVINILALIAGVIAVIVIIISGLRYILSQGDPNSIASAQRSLIYALVGLAVAALARSIVAFVLVKL
jgi:hypothetical protein